VGRSPRYHPWPAGPSRGRDRPWNTARDRQLASLMERLDVTIHLDYAFDLGYEIDLTNAQTLLQGHQEALPRRRRTPESIRYRPAPIRVPIEVADVSLPGGVETTQPPRGELVLFDFAAVSLTLHFPVRLSPEALLKLAGELADSGPLNAAARRVLAPWVERIRPAVVGFEPSEMSEEYILFQVTDPRTDWRATRAAWIAGLVRLESGPLSDDEVAEATRLSLSYAPDDLVTLDWAAGFIADRDCAETLQVIEFANVQLLEFRHIDDRLDDRLEAAYRDIRPTERRRAGLLWRSHDAALRSVRELEIEATSLFERADNALKLIGDQYLARIFDLAQERFHLPEWEQNIRRKLDTVGDVFDLLVQQSGGHRMEVLEIIVVVLITLEIVLALLRH
jgi:hypothetical protein